MVYINETIHRKSCELHLNTVNKTSELCISNSSNDMCSEYNEYKTMYSI